MARMIRKQIYIRPEQEEMLKRRAKELGISEAELIRQRIATGPTTGSVSYPTNPAAWEEELRFIKERAAKLPDLKRKRTWTREDAYEERFARYNR